MRRELFVGNLPFSTNDESLNKLFAEAGSVESAKVIMDRMSGRSRGFGFVTMQTVEEATAAIDKLNNREVDGRPIRVHFSNSEEQRGGGGGSRPRPSGNGGGFGGGNGGGSFQRKSFGPRG
jgi:cold-inducible RNA-binding protein